MQVSVITAVYNKEDVLIENLSHTLSQKGIEFELVLIDDKSPDRCPMLLDELSLKEPRAKVIHHEKNGGHVAAVNTGIRNAKGDYLIVVDADDYLNYEYALRDMYEIAISTQCDAVFSDFLNVGLADYNSTYIGKEYLIKSLRDGTYHPTTRSRLYKASVFKDNLLKNYIIDDEEWSLRTIYGLSSIAIYDKNIYTRVTPPTSVTQNPSEKNYYVKSRDRLLATQEMVSWYNSIAINEKGRDLIIDRILALYFMALNIRLTHIFNEDYAKEIDSLIFSSCKLLKYSHYSRNLKYKLFSCYARLFGIESAMRAYRRVL